VISDLIEFLDLDPDRRRNIIRMAYSECECDDESLAKVAEVVDEAQSALIRNRLKAAAELHALDHEGPLGALFVTVGYME
jgi:hypothetical protein